MSRWPMSSIERFWGKVDKDGPLPSVSPSLGACWVWTAGLMGRGYGSFYSDGMNRPAHRHSWEIMKGKIPDGLDLDHLCRTLRCVNPAHLEPVTHKENVLRGIGPTSSNARKSSCVRGHLFDESNTYTSKDGKRSCRKCHADREKSRYQARKLLTTREERRK